MNTHLKTSIALVLAGTAIVAQAQAPSKEEMSRAFKANDFAKALMKAAAPAGKSLTGSLGLNEMHQWFCSMQVKGQGVQASVTETDAASPERACVQALLQLSKQKAI